MYNLEVDGWHTYFVSDASVLVHNKCRPTPTVPKHKLNQMPKRGWTDADFDDVINNPFRTGKSINRRTGNTAKVYANQDGSYIVVDDVTNEIVQMSNKNIPDWIPDQNIMWDQ